MQVCNLHIIVAAQIWNVLKMMFLLCVKLFVLCGQRVLLKKLAEMSGEPTGNNHRDSLRLCVMICSLFTLTADPFYIFRTF